MPIQIIMFEDRMEIRNQGGLYGRIRVDQLGKVQPDTRNFVVKFYKEVVMKTDASLTLKEVAVTFGFYDEYHFGKCFKKHFGYSPKSVALYKTKEV